MNLHCRSQKAWQSLLGGIAVLLCFSMGVRAQEVNTMSVHLSDGRVINYDISRIDSVTFVDIPRWSNRSPEARKLLAYMADNVGKQMLTGVHASVNYNTHEADWVYKHTGKYPAINCIDYIHDIYSSSDGWIDYGNQTIWRGWTNKRGIMAALWHWNMPTNDGKSYTCTPGTADGETSFRPSVIFDPSSAGYRELIRRIDQVAAWMKPLQQARVPILWRPLHEAQGNWSDENPGTSWHKAWFWWGIDGPEAFVELWRVMYDRMACVANYENWKLWKGSSQYECIVNYERGKIWKGSSQYECLFNFSDEPPTAIIMFIVYYYYRGAFE